MFFRSVLIALITACLLSASCKKSEDYQPVRSADYMAVTSGKVLIYRLDSTVLLPFGAGLKVNSYQAKDSLNDSFFDNQGRRSFRVYRYIRDLAGTQAWAYNSTYYITPTASTVEVTESNMRFIKLADDININTTWKGNAYINTTSGSTYSYLDGWDYTYQNINEPFTTLRGNIDSTVTVFQQDALVPDAPFNAATYQEKDYGVEVYAKGIGLVYKEFLHWRYLGDPVRAYDDGSYGIKLNLLQVR
jgi:hypothetical protein